MTTKLNQPQFQDADKAREYLEALRWPEGPVCPHCGVNGDHYALKGKAHRAGLWKCAACRQQFSVTVGTVFERSKVALNVWLMAVHLLCASKKGMSAHQIHRMLGVTYKTAWFMCHRIREAMKPNGGGLLGAGGGVVEVDETFWGIRKGQKRKSGYQHKMKVVALIERGGQARAVRIGSLNRKTIREVLQANVAKEARLMTDEANWYVVPGAEFAEHQRVNHHLKEYARGDAHVNNAEGYFAIFKRGMIGTYHKCGEQHLQRYVNEFDFRYNTRENTDSERSAVLLARVGGKRLTYGGSSQN